MLFLHVGFAFVFAFLVTLYLVPLVMAVAYQFRFVDVPDGKIKRHARAVPYLGGVAVYAGFLIGISIIIPFENKLCLFLLGTMLLLMLGLIDDLVVLKPREKFFGQIVSSLCFLKAGLYLKGHFFYSVWNIPLSFFWILSVTNAFNLIDVMDGLATLVALIASITFFYIAYILYNPALMIVLASLIGSLTAFFWYNKPGARIYLGDAGALFLGGALATIPFFFDWGLYNVYGYLAPTIILAIPLFELVSLIVVRAYRGIPFYRASPDHFSLRLQSRGWTKEYILWGVFCYGFALAIIALLFVRNIISPAMVIIIGLLLMISEIALVWKKPLKIKSFFKV